MMSLNRDFVFITEYIKNVLYFATVREGRVLRNTHGTHCFCIDKDLVYENYYSDFGPLNLGCIYKYCHLLNEKLKQYLNQEVIIHYTSTDPKLKSNAALLIGCYGVLYMNLTPREALKPLIASGQSYKPFQDAAQGESMYTISLLDCLQAVKKARELGLVNFQDFDHEEYDKWNRVQGGDLNWIVPEKFIAFIGPIKSSFTVYHPPEDYIDYFLESNVKVVIRLNKKMYDSEVFTDAGIQHYDLYFPDGSCPPRHILFKFLQISENTDGALAVHCKAGLGRTGSLIGAYLMKHYRMSAREAISWMRICRPGSVIGHQQAWLEQLEPWLKKQGNLYRKRLYRDPDALPVHEYGVYSIAWGSGRKLRNVLSKPPPDKNVIKRETRSDIVPISFKSSNLTEPDRMANIYKISSKTPTKVTQTSSKTKGGMGDPRPSFTEKAPVSSSYTSTHGSRNFNVRSDYGKNNLVKYLNPAIRVAHYGGNSSNYSNIGSKEIPPSPFTSVFSRTSPSTYAKRNLGRSPSPSPTRVPSNFITSTSQSPTRANKSNKNDHQSSLKVVPRPKLMMPRDHSLGSSSVDARRNAPTAIGSLGRQMSARSDERNLATQGDMLNSIKMQRRFMESVKKMKDYQQSTLFSRENKKY